MSKNYWGRRFKKEKTFLCFAKWKALLELIGLIPIKTTYLISGNILISEKIVALRHSFISHISSLQNYQYCRSNRIQVFLYHSFLKHFLWKIFQKFSMKFLKPFPGQCPHFIYIPWKHQKTKGSLVFSGSIKWKHWPDMVLRSSLGSCYFHRQSDFLKQLFCSKLLNLFEMH